MKKIIIALLIMVVLVAAGVVGYFYYYLPSKTPITESEEAIEQIQQQTQLKEQQAKEQYDYYVGTAKLGVRESPDPSAFITRYLYPGEAVHLLEKKADWGRISEYMMFDKGSVAVAEWIPLADLLDHKPDFSDQELQRIVLDYVAQSDDLVLYEERFIKKSEELLATGQCRPIDFEVLGGWVRSMAYPNEAVYFVYCGGMEPKHKVYLNAETGRLFTLN